ncbi:hypothetical protein BDV93DRAFT_307447 [Ceratobasidium sp. AG-I]|nr:hypothetical protein BDV93DRAFT_307447 [Ceratobasidium sp. AG-I]
MDPTAGTTVSLGTIGVSCAGALGGAAYAFVKSQPPSLMGFAAGVNSGIAGLTFFALREYAISPALVLSLDTPQYARRRAELVIESPQHAQSDRIAYDSTDELRAIRQNKLLDTALSGALAGAGLNAWRRGPRAIIPGAITASLACALLQFAVNELSVQRIRYVAGTPVPAGILAAAPSTVPASPSTIAATRIPVAVVLQPPPEDKPLPKPRSQKIVDTISYVIPLTRLDDKEYLERLEKKRDVIDGKIDRLHKELSTDVPGPS